jgi:hypothetical protein
MSYGGTSATQGTRGVFPQCTRIRHLISLLVVIQEQARHVPDQRGTKIPLSLLIPFILSLPMPSVSGQAVASGHAIVPQCFSDVELVGAVGLH